MRFFIELSYMGTAYSGFQIQRNANSIQAEVEKALLIYCKKAIVLTGSSRTDAGVHAIQNFFHFDSDEFPCNSTENLQQPNLITQLSNCVYHLNAMLPRDIAIIRIFKVSDEAHCRFDASSREYHYGIYQRKNPFVERTAYYYPYRLDVEKMNKAAALIVGEKDFTSFSKKNTQVRHFQCTVKESEWSWQNDKLIYTVKANRFLRGMVKGLVGTMLRVGTQKISVKEFEKIIESRDCKQADFSVPSHGLFLVKVEYPPLLLLPYHDAHD
ncbi:tRNA pseudouridine(38-40) synthase TruA [Hanamia caeni]|uniref:tRNA pseudouridine synthase A n=1 Tax=Hanamia caeni TaxID=2294116 RepID=A0A3M9NNC7_9BACT|nr:tRNA pseudouridine(38-40) synthase TruA [Hanamia caeni]RNI39184.1 tRNA pseudouridine(38-40) synthase TruA [Hanamia caeni]